MLVRTGTSNRQRKEKHTQKTLIEFDPDLQDHCEAIENSMFDREARNAALNDGGFHPPSGSLFDAIFQELKRKEEREKHRHGLSNMAARLFRRDKVLAERS
jgi:hypothetical protein